MKYILIALLLLLAPTVYALNASQVPTKNLLVEWVEPDTSFGGKPLTDLSKIIIHATIDGVEFDPMEVAASGPTGGQPGQHIYLGVCQPNTEPVADIKAYAVDLTGNVSEEALTNMTIDCLPPGKVK